MREIPAVNPHRNKLAGMPRFFGFLQAMLYPGSKLRTLDARHPKKCDVLAVYAMVFSVPVLMNFIPR
jgi:hypothetical protein